MIAKVMLAPMAGVTDLPFRVLCVRFGCELAYTEMVSAKGLYFRNEKTKTLLELDESERQTGVQLFGSDPDIVAQMAGVLVRRYAQRLAALDVNMGCPAHKIVSNGEGCALMNDLPRASKILSSAVRAAGGLPVTVKFRKGWDGARCNAVEFARMAEEAGVAAVTVHGRTRAQFYEGKADWTVIAAVKQAVKIPVIGNGDIFSGEDAKNMFAQTGCDAVMVARGAQGNPWIFAEIQAALAGRAYTPPSNRERVALAREHMSLHAARKGERAFVQMRKHIAWYMKGMPGAPRLRMQVNQARTQEEMTALLSAYERAVAG